MMNVVLVPYEILGNSILESGNLVQCHVDLLGCVLSTNERPRNGL